MPKKEDGRPCTSRSLFTKAEKEETQLPMKWSAWPKMYRSSWAESGWRCTTFTCTGKNELHKLITRRVKQIHKMRMKMKKKNDVKSKRNMSVI